MKISVIVPAYRRPALQAKLASFAAELPAELEILLVMYASEAENLVGAQAEFPSLPARNLIIPDRPGLYPVAVKRNAGAREAGGEILLFTDDDVLYVPGAIESLQSLYSTGFKGIASPDLFYEDGSVLRAGRGQSLAWNRLNGSFLALDRESFAQLKGFREEIKGRGGEDIDLAYRARRMGIKLRRLEGKLAVHQGSPRADAQTGYACGYGAFNTARWNGAIYALGLGVHPLQLAFKSWALRLGAAGLFAPRAMWEYERGYLEGAREAQRGLDR